MAFSLTPFTRNDTHGYTNTRVGETKIGQSILLLSSAHELKNELNSFPGKFCLLGIPEDIGPVANLGKAGAAGMFADFLGYFLNMQDNRFLSGADILMLGVVKVDDLLQKAAKLSSKNEDELHELRLLVAEIDRRVFPIIQEIVAAGKIPVVIGGGHNNAYPLIKGSFLGLGKKPVGCINIDPHADLRLLEGRHSGNGFSYAIADGYLDKYHPVGLHHNYNNEYMWDKLNSDKDLFRYVTYEDIIEKDLSSSDVVNKALKYLKGMPIALEIDVDSIRFAESSAKTPVGFSENKIRKLIRLLAADKNIVYLNLSEGIPSTHYQTGKLMAYLVSDFIRANSI